MAAIVLHNTQFENTAVCSNQGKKEGRMEGEGRVRDKELFASNAIENDDRNDEWMDRWCT